MTPELSKSESSDYPLSSAAFTLHLLSTHSTVEEGLEGMDPKQKTGEREHFCAESASILDRFVRLTDFERLTMVDKERICCSL